MVSVFFGRCEERCNLSDLHEQRSVSGRQEGLWRSTKESSDPVGRRGSDVKPRFGMGSSGSLIFRPQNHVLLYHVGHVNCSSAARVLCESSTRVAGEGELQP